MKTNQRDKAKKNGGVSIRVVGVITTITAVLLAFFAFAVAGFIADLQQADAADETRYVQCHDAIENLQAGSDYLTTQARMFIITGRKDYLNNYLDEFLVNNRRGKSVDVLKANLADDRTAEEELQKALDTSNELAQSELTAMRLAADYYKLSNLPQELATADMSKFDPMPEGEAKLNAAMELVLSTSYDETKQSISDSVDASFDALLSQLNATREKNENLMQGLLFQLRIAVALLLCIIMILVLALFMYVLKPLGRYVEHLKEGEALSPEGAYELHYLANAYNTIYEDNSKRIEHLREFAEQDPLTGISNRAGYDSFLATHTRNIALLLIDIDNFKEYNSVYGNDIGDAVLIKLADALGTAFRSTDFPCRIEGDLFAVVMTNMGSESRNAIFSKVELVNSMLTADTTELPAVSLSVGAAFSTEGMSDHEIYEAASSALKLAKNTRSGDVVFYGESNAAK